MKTTGRTESELELGRESFVLSGETDSRETIPFLNEKTTNLVVESNEIENFSPT